MSTADVTADVPKTRTVSAAKSIVTRPVFISWLALAFMTTSSVASLRAAPMVAVLVPAAVFLCIVPAIVFLLPTSFVSDRDRAHRARRGAVPAEAREGAR